MPLQVNDVGNFECSRTFFQKKKKIMFLAVHNMILEFRGVASFARSGGGAKFKSGGQRFSRNPKAFSGRNHKFSAHKQVISEKKGLRRNPKAFSGRNVFSSEKQQLLPPKKIPWRGKKKIEGGIAPPAPPLATRLLEFHAATVLLN